MSESVTILFVGPTPWGSDSRALAMAFREAGALVIEVNRDDYLPMRWSSLPLRAARRLLRPLILRDHDRAVRAFAENRAIDFVLLFKGMLVTPATVRAFRDAGRAVYGFYPDVRFDAHGPEIPACLPLFDCLFTTKSYHAEDPAVRSAVREVVVLRHGFDPAVHREVAPSARALEAYACDVSFVGCWSPKKERAVASLLEAIPDLRLDLWGPAWDRAAPPVRRHWRGRGAYGDELVAIHRASAINLGLLSEAGTGGGSGDRVTARTWQIPAAGAFLLHERTDELLAYFRDGEEVASFEGDAGLAERVRHFLVHSGERECIRQAGRARCLREDYTYRPAARAILDHHAARAARSGR